MSSTLVSFGANVGDVQQTWHELLAYLRRDAVFRIVSASRPIRTNPIGGAPGQQAFLNGVILGETQLSASRFLEYLRRVEGAFGRVPAERWSSRVLDLDILLFDDMVLRTETLEIPHPRMSFRRFVLEPAVEVAANWRHPVIGLTLRDLLDRVEKNPDYVALAGANWQDRLEIARTVCRLEGHRHISLMGNPGKFPGGRSRSVSLEFLGQKMAEITAAIGDCESSAKYVISDFWETDVETEPAISMEQGSSRSDAKVSPKLLVLLDSPGAEDFFGIHSREELDFPILRISLDDPEWVVTEVLAAMKAMIPLNRENA